jgi:hypothetical protein
MVLARSRSRTCAWQHTHSRARKTRVALLADVAPPRRSHPVRTPPCIPMISGVEGKLSGWRGCGDGLPRYHYFDLRARRLSCGYARRSANHHFRTGDRRFHGWRCHDRMRFESGKTRCHRRKHGRLQAFKYFFGV